MGNLHCDLCKDTSANKNANLEDNGLLTLAEIISRLSGSEIKDADDWMSEVADEVRSEDKISFLGRMSELFTGVLQCVTV